MPRAAGFEPYWEGELPREPSANAGSDGASPSPRRCCRSRRAQSIRQVFNNADLRVQGVRSGRRASLDAYILARQVGFRGAGGQLHSCLGSPSPHARCEQSRAARLARSGARDRQGRRGRGGVRGPRQRAPVAAGTDGHHYLRYVEQALVPRGDGAGRRASAGDESSGRGGACQGGLDHPRPEQLHGGLSRPPGPETGASRRPRPRTCPRTSASGATRSRPKRKGPTRSTSPMGAATTGPSARRDHRGDHRSPPSPSKTTTRSAIRAPRSGTCSKAGASPMSCSWAFIPTCASSAGRSACATWPGSART